MTPDQRIERSRRPWETADADEVVDLFTPGAFCQSSVFCEPYVGSDAIRQYWQGGAGTQRDVTVRMERPVIIDARVAAEWRTTMTNPDEGEITQPGCFLLRFAPTGAARTCGNTGRSSPAGKTRPTAGNLAAPLARPSPHQRRASAPCPKPGIATPGTCLA